MSETQDHDSTESQVSGKVPQHDPWPPTPELKDSSSFPKARKRKRGDVGNGIRLGEMFSVQAHPSLLSANTQQLIPSLLLPRPCLLISFLDPSIEDEDMAEPSLFSANIEALEGDRLGDLADPPMVLIALSAENDKLWAVERVQQGIYALYRLQRWVTLQALEQTQSQYRESSCVQKIQGSQHARQTNHMWWHNTVIRPMHDVRSCWDEYTRVRKSACFNLCLQRPSQKVSLPGLGPNQRSYIEATNVIDNLENVVEEVSQAPAEILDTISSQYQEALYASKTPLAYFAKGPLSRARAHFHSCDGSSYDLSLLTQFFRSKILSLTTMDRKYRETLPTVIRDLPFGILSDDESVATVAAREKKARKRKKTKIGRNGLYDGEEVDITRWWTGRQLSHHACDSTDARDNIMKATLLNQRARETQLQVILVLETLALEACATGPNPKPVSTEEFQEKDGASQNNSKKPKKPQDLSTQLDLLADRLCIWQSMSVDHMKPSSGDDKTSHEREVIPPTGVVQNEHLRGFCVDIVLPFYGARLPKETALLCSKLGGPMQPSPQRPSLAKATSFNASLRSTSSTHRERVRKPRRTLDRVLTDEQSASQKRPPSLSRSLTEPVLPQIKREKSDTSLCTIPLNRVAMHKRYSQREVDFQAASQATEAKLKQKAKVEQELQNAIAALKKPNPRMAVKELVEDAERRVARSRSRKSQNPTRNPFGQGVQVMATPSKNRRTNVIVTSLPSSHTAAAPAPEVNEVLPSSVSRISDSTRKAQRSSFSVTEVLQQPPEGILLAHEQTPTKHPLGMLSRGLRPSTSSVGQDGFVVPSFGRSDREPSNFVAGTSKTRNLSAYRRNIQDTPSKVRMPSYSKEREGIVQVTPNKAMVTTIVPMEKPAMVIPPSMDQQEQSIYAKLGWDDDIDDLA